MKIIDSLSSPNFTNNPLLRTLGLSISGKLFTPLSFYGGICINGSIEGLTLCLEKGLSLATGKLPREKMRVFIHGATTTAVLATLFFSALLYPSIRGNFIGKISLKALAYSLLFLFFQTIAINVFTKKRIGCNTLFQLEEWVKMGESNEDRVSAKSRICKFLASDSSLLDLGVLNLSSLPDIFNDPRFNKLQVLVLKNNRLTTLPESLGGLKALKILDLAWNKLTKLPESFGGLKALEALHLRDNKLTELPKSFGQLEALKELDLSCNQLKPLPVFLGQLHKLNVQVYA